MLRFSKFLENANFDIVTKYTLRKKNNDSADVLFVRKYCQLFTHESNTFLFLKYTQNAIQTNGEKNPKPPVPQGHVDPI